MCAMDFLGPDLHLSWAYKRILSVVDFLFERTRHIAVGRDLLH